MTSGKEYYRMTVKGALDALDTSEEGLTRDEANRRLEKYGKNELKATVQTPKWLMFLSQFKELLVIVLIVAGVISLILGSYKNAAAMFIIVIINAVIGFVQRYKAQQIIEKLKSLIKISCQSHAGR